MTDYSANSEDIFKGLEWGNVILLSQVIRECKLISTKFISQKYKEKASNFNITLAFMTKLGVLKIQGENLRAHKGLLNNKDSEIRFWLFNRLFHFPNPYRTKILYFLRKFRLEAGDPILNPSWRIQNLYSHTRNFLMEMKIVQYNQQSGCYLISPDHIGIYILSLEHANKKSLSALHASNRSKDALGLAAEKKIVTYEIQRVGAKYANQVDHVALRNTAAGYDIRSMTVNEDGSTLPRYIEVKAVSSRLYNFYWTKNEVLTAQKLADWYYLYLLPVNRNGSYDIKGLKILSNPYYIILKEENEWMVESDVIKCYLKENECSFYGAKTDVN